MMRRSKEIAAAAIAFATIFAIFWYCRQEKVRIEYHLQGLQRAGHMLDVLAGKVPQTPGDRVRRLLSFNDSNSHWADIMERHEKALLRLGYLTRQEFRYSAGAFSAEEVRTNCLFLMGDYTASFSIAPSQGVIEVVARPVEMKTWAILISELDKQQRQ
jgi:hypothetical protein